MTSKVQVINRLFKINLIVLLCTSKKKLSWADTHATVTKKRQNVLNQIKVKHAKTQD